MTNNTLSDRASLWTPAEKTQRDNGWRYSFAEIESVRDRAQSDAGYGGELEFAEAVMAIADERLAKREITQSTADRVAELEAALVNAIGGLDAMIRLSEMTIEESLQEPEENGNFASYERAKRCATEARAALKGSSDG